LLLNSVLQPRAVAPTGSRWCVFQQCYAHSPRILLPILALAVVGCRWLSFHFSQCSLALISILAVAHGPDVCRIVAACCGPRKDTITNVTEVLGETQRKLKYAIQTKSEIEKRGKTVGRKGVTEVLGETQRKLKYSRNRERISIKERQKSKRPQGQRFTVAERKREEGTTRQIEE